MESMQRAQLYPALTRKLTVKMNQSFEPKKWKPPHDGEFSLKRVAQHTVKQ